VLVQPESLYEELIAGGTPRRLAAAQAGAAYKASLDAMGSVHEWVARRKAAERAKR
jgi:hypothetical protein